MCVSGNRLVVETYWNIRSDKLKKLQRPIAQFLFGNFTAPPFFCPGKCDSPRPISIVTTCTNGCNAYFRSTEIHSIYRCSTGLGGVVTIFLTSGKWCGTRYGGGDPASRACL
jgi:hypothetical protein